MTRAEQIREEVSFVLWAMAMAVHVVATMAVELVQLAVAGSARRRHSEYTQGAVSVLKATPQGNATEETGDDRPAAPLSISSRCEHCDGHGWIRGGSPSHHLGTWAERCRMCK